MSLNLSKEELKSLKDLYNLNDIKFTDARYNDTKIRKNIIDSISTLLVASVLGKSLYIPEEADDVQDLIKNKSDKITLLFAESIAIALTVGYLQSLNNDRVIEETPDFGYKGIDEAFQTAVITYMNEFTSSDKVDKLLENGLGVKIRECDVKDYFKNEYYHKDIEILANILTVDIDDGYNKRIKNVLNNLGDISTSLDVYMEDLKATYTLLLEDGFGIRPYVGVFSGSNGFITIHDDDIEAKLITNGELTLKKLAQRIYSRISSSVKVSDSRQFNYDEIFKSNTPVYFPNKIIEYVLGRESTLNLNKNVYKLSTYSVSWETYSENYVFPNLREILLRGVYKAFEKVLLDNDKIKTNFISREFTSTVSNYKDFVMEHLSDSEVYNSVFEYMSKVVNSLKCFYILTKYPFLANKITAINIRVTCQSGSNNFSADSSVSESLFKGLVATNDREIFLAPFDLTHGRTSATNVNISINIYEYQYDINPMLSHAEPLFGYTIQKQNQRKGKVSDWENILIGESMSGKELYASSTSDIKLQNKFIHNIIAGSRSGKGVMTMNILVSALVSGKPIFYLDRKPDMASMLYHISNGNQFIVNGGLINPGFDIYKCFDTESGPALSLWKNTELYLKDNPKILELFKTTNTNYDSILGDYVYLRAFMFCMGLCVLRTKLKGKNDKLRDDIFNGDNGIVIVVDELTGFQSKIGELLSDINSLMVSKALALGDAEEVLNKKADLEAKIHVKQVKIGEANKESARLDLEREIDGLKTQINSLVDEQSLYASTLFSKIKSSFATLQSQIVAGFKNKEFNYSDIFVLGQYLDANYYASSLTAKNKGSLSSVFFPLTSDKKDYYTLYKKADIVRSFLEETGESDWFLGRNPDFKNYGGKNENEQAQKVTDVDGNWDYVGSHTCNEIRGVDYASFSHVLFKPYLVLNTHYENTPPTADSSNLEYQYVTQCANRVNENAGGINLWETVRLKHIKSDMRDSVTADNPRYDSLEEGIGFKGLVKETLLTTKNGKEHVNSNFDSYIQDILGKSGKIANYVAGKMGYSCWQELIFDFSPKGLFSFDDMVNAVINEDLYTMESRLPLYAKLGLLGDMSNSDDSLNGNLSESFDDKFGDVFDELPDDGKKHEESSYETFDSQQSVNEQTSENSLDDWFDEELGIGDYSDEQEEPVNNYQENNSQGSRHGWTEEDRNKIAESLVTAYLMGIKTANYDMYVHFNNPNLRSSIVSVMKELLIEEGF